jgi:hypothetical protein
MLVVTGRLRWQAGYPHQVSTHMPSSTVCFWSLVAGQTPFSWKRLCHDVAALGW